jgi:hypothetical protein
MTQKTRFIMDLAAFLADHPGLAKRGPDFILEVIRTGHESIDEVRDLVEFIATGVPHLIDEGDVFAALLEAERISKARDFDDDETPTAC